MFDDDERRKESEVKVTCAAKDTTSDDTDVDPKKVRPVQMGDCVRNYVSV